MKGIDEMTLQQLGQEYLASAQKIEAQIQHLKEEYPERRLSNEKFILRRVELLSAQKRDLLKTGNELIGYYDKNKPSINKYFNIVL